MDHIQELSDIFWPAQSCASHIGVSIAIGNGRSQDVPFRLTIITRILTSWLLLTLLGRGENSELAAIFSFLSPFSYRKLHDEFKQDNSGQIH